MPAAAAHGRQHASLATVRPWRF